MKSVARAAVAALLVSALACADRERSEVDEAADRVEASAEETGQEIRDEARDLGEYSYDEREDFRTAVREEVSELDEEIDELGRDTRGAAGAVSAEAMEDIRTARRAIDERLEGLGDATEDEWEEFRGNIENSLEQARQSIADVRSTAGPMGGRAAGQN